MANIINEFKTVLFEREPIKTGKIVKIDGNLVTILSNVGTRIFSVPSPDYYKIGNTVYFKENVLLGTLSKQENLDRYSV